MATPTPIISKNPLSISLPLTAPTGKIRVKQRDTFSEYGQPVAVKTTKMQNSNYVEWQIGYDLLANEENKNYTSLKNTFTNYKKELKYAYELSEIVYYSLKNCLLRESQIKDTYNTIANYKKENFLDNIDTMDITRTHPKEVKINNMDFFYMSVSYPLIVKRFKNYQIYVEILTKEKQRAVGVQPMLYVCIPITELEFKKQVIGRPLETKEYGKWNVTLDVAEFSLEVFKMFGMLTEKHNYDVCQIFKTLFDDII